jgi:hypothetical protein
MRKALASFIAAAIGIGAVVALSYRLLGAAAGPEAQLISLVKRTEVEGMKLSVSGSGGVLSSRVHHFDRLSVHLGDDGTAYVVGSLDFQGVMGATVVSSVGLEKIPFQYQQGRWQPVAGWAPNLTAVVAALQAKNRATPGVEGTYRPTAWYIRIERDEAIVTEDSRPSLAQAPGDGARTRRLSLHKRGSDFSFEGGLL